MIRRLPAVLAATVALSVAAAFAKTDAVALIPNDAVTVGVVHLSEMRTSPLSSMLFQQTDKISSNGDAQTFLQDAGLQPAKDIDVLVVSTSPRANLGSTDADVLVAADGRFNVELLSAALVKRGAVRKNGYYLLPQPQESTSGKSGAAAFPSSQLALVGTEEAVAEALANLAAGGTTFLTGSGLGREVSRIDPKATAWAVVDVARASRLTHAPRVPSNNQSGAALQSAMKNVSTVALWATDTGDSLKLSGLGVSRDTETLQLLEDTIRGALAAMRLAVQDKSPDLVGVLRKFDVSHTTDTVQVTGSIPAETLRTFVAKQHAMK